MKPRVAIVVAAYDPGPYLVRALESVQAQSMGSWELVVVDDGSHEDLAWVTEVDDRVRRVRQENAGVSVARNVGVASTSAPVVAFLDGDDEWLPGKLDAQLRVLDSDHSISMCDTAFEIIDAQGARIGRGYEGHHRSYEELLEGCGIGLSTVSVRREAFVSAGGFDPVYRLVQDWGLFLRIAKGARLHRVDEVLARYRLHGANATRDYMLALHEAVHLLQGHRLAAKAAGNEHAASAAGMGIHRARLLFGTQAFDQALANKRKPARLLVHLWRALRLNPRFVGQSLARKLGRRSGAGAPSA